MTVEYRFCLYLPSCKNTSSPQNFVRSKAINMEDYYTSYPFLTYATQIFNLLCAILRSIVYGMCD